MWKLLVGTQSVQTDLKGITRGTNYLILFYDTLEEYKELTVEEKKWHGDTESSLGVKFIPSNNLLQAKGNYQICQNWGS